MNPERSHHDAPVNPKQSHPPDALATNPSPASQGSNSYSHPSAFGRYICKCLVTWLTLRAVSRSATRTNRARRLRARDDGGDAHPPSSTSYPCRPTFLHLHDARGIASENSAISLIPRRQRALPDAALRWCGTGSNALVAPVVRQCSRTAERGGATAPAGGAQRAARSWLVQGHGRRGHSVQSVGRPLVKCLVHGIAAPGPQAVVDLLVQLPELVADLAAPVTPGSVPAAPVDRPRLRTGRHFALLCGEGGQHLLLLALGHAEVIQGVGQFRGDFV